MSKNWFVKGASEQNNQLELAFSPKGRGEASKIGGQGTESPLVGPASENPAVNERLMEEVCERRNLEKALKRVKANKGGPGIDGMEVYGLAEFLKAHWTEIRGQLLSGKYKPTAVKRVEIPKPDGGVRKLGIPTVLDRFIQQAVLQVLQGQWEPYFSEHSYGFRPGRSAHMAVAKAQGYIAEGYGYVVDIDLEKFFDRVNHDKLMGLIAKRTSDKRVLGLLRGYLNAGVLEEGLVRPTDEGTPQGGPLSPLLSNIMLDELDKELEKRGHRFVRYADDSNIYVKSERAGQRVMESISRFITKRLKLKVNEQKSGVDRPSERKFLGFSFTKGKELKRCIAPKAIARFKERVRELTKQDRASMAGVIKKLAQYLRGWNGYFGFCQTPSVLDKLNSWIRRRVRNLFWQQWKKPAKRFKELTRRGIKGDLARRTAYSSKGSWRISRSPAINIALPNAHLNSLGLPNLKVYGVA